jgi:hypothetical protein
MVLLVCRGVLVLIPVDIVVVPVDIFPVITVPVRLGLVLIDVPVVPVRILPVSIVPVVFDVVVHSPVHDVLVLFVPLVVVPLRSDEVIVSLPLT